MIVVKDVDFKCSGKIEFEDISREAYNKLLEFVQSLNSGEETVEKPAEEEKPKEDAPRPPVAKKTEEKKKAANNAKVPSYLGAVDKLKGIVEYAKAHPDEYEFRPVQTKEFYAEHAEEFAGISEISVGKAAETIGLERKRISDKRYPNPRRVREYPMKKSAPAKTGGESLTEIHGLKNWSLKQAGFLREKRRQVGLSIKELSDMIQYPFNAIQAWENCQAEPSTGAIDAYCARFGEKFRAELQAVS